MKIVINACYGGFALSEEVYKELGIKWDGYGCLRNEDLGIESDNYMAYRADIRLIAAINKVGLKKASGRCSNLSIVEIPSDVTWKIQEYDGYETIHEVHRSWA